MRRERGERIERGRGERESSLSLLCLSLLPLLLKERIGRDVGERGGERERGVEREGKRERSGQRERGKEREREELEERESEESVRGE